MKRVMVIHKIIIYLDIFLCIPNKVLHKMISMIHTLMSRISWSRSISNLDYGREMSDKSVSNT